MEQTAQTGNQSTRQQWGPLAPALRVRDLKKAVDTYTKVGFKTQMTMPGPDGNLAHAGMYMGSSMMMLAPFGAMSEDADAEYEKNVEKGPHGLGVNLYTLVPDVQKVFDTVRKEGWTVKSQIKEQFWGDKTFWCIDPFGYAWTFAQNVRTPTPEEMMQAMKELSK